MLLTMDIGNTQIYGGIFVGDQLRTFRMKTDTDMTSDEIGLFLRNIIREWGLEPQDVSNIAIASVVPVLQHTLRAASIKYFDIRPFIVGPGIKTGLKMKVHNPAEVGADRIVNAAYASSIHFGKNLIIVDLGTATTFCVVTEKQEYMGGLILPGLKTSQYALTSRAAKLPGFEIARPEKIVGKNTIECLQSGLYYSHLGAVNSILDGIVAEQFPEDSPLIIGTGGFCNFLSNELPLDHVYPDLTLKGLRYLLDRNKDRK